MHNGNTKIEMVKNCHKISPHFFGKKLNCFQSKFLLFWNCNSKSWTKVTYYTCYNICTCTKSKNCYPKIVYVCRKKCKKRYLLLFSQFQHYSLSRKNCFIVIIVLQINYLYRIHRIQTFFSKLKHNNNYVILNSNTIFFNDDVLELIH